MAMNPLQLRAIFEASRQKQMGSGMPMQGGMMRPPSMGMPTGGGLPPLSAPGMTPISPPMPKISKVKKVKVPNLKKLKKPGKIKI